MSRLDVHGRSHRIISHSKGHYKHKILCAHIARGNNRLDIYNQSHLYRRLKFTFHVQKPKSSTIASYSSLVFGLQ